MHPVSWQISNIFLLSSLEILEIVKNIVEEGIEKDEIKPYDSEIVTSEIFGLACSSLLQKKTKEIKVDELFKDLDKSYVQNLKKVKA